MTFLVCLRNDLQKEKRSVLLPLLVLISLGTTGVMFLDMWLRYDSYLAGIAKTKGVSSWAILLNEYHGVLGWGTFFPIFIALISSALYYTEYKQNAWKQYMSLPVSRSTVLLSKYTSTCLLSILLILGNMLGLCIVGKIFSFPEPFDSMRYGSYLLSQCGGVLAIAAIQNWVNAFSSQFLASPLVSITGLVLASILPEHSTMAAFFPYTYTMTLENSMAGGLVWGIIILIISIYTFSKQDILGGETK